MIDSNLVGRIIDKFPHVVYRQQNPFSVDNPDLLVFNGRVLIGVYYPTKAEANNSDDLLRRLYASKLALMGQMRTVLVLDIHNEAMKLVENRVVNNAFDFVYCFESEQDFFNLMDDNLNQRTAINKGLKTNNMNRFWATMNYVDRLNKTKRPSLPKEFEYNSFYGEVGSWSDPNNPKRVKTTFLAGDTLVSFKRKTKQPFKSDFDSLMTFVMMFNYTLDDGQLIPDRNNSKVFRYLGTDGMDYLVNDETYLRSLVFLGLVPSTFYEPNAIESLRLDYMTYLDNNKIRL